MSTSTPTAGSAAPDAGTRAAALEAETAADLLEAALAEADGTAPVQAAGRRRTFAVISHPDAGKSTLTEALALHGGAIGQAGIVQGKGGRRGVVSDWLDMEKARGISITSAALQFVYRDHVVNLLDTPGHADFSEDTYRVLTAVDSAVMLVDAAKGMERQTMKLFDVCKLRGLPVLTVINKWDRPGLEALELMDEIAEKTGMTPTPVLWPVGIGGDFRGLLDLRDDTYIAFEAGTGGATRTQWTRMGLDEALEREGDVLTTALEEAELITSSPTAATTRRRSAPAGRAPSCSPPPCSTAGSSSCSTSSWRPRRPRATGPRSPTGWSVTSATRSAGRCSRCRPAWTPTTATTWRSSGCPPDGSTAARPSSTPATARSSAPSTPTASSAARAPAWRTPGPATWSPSSTPAACASATRCSRGARSPTRRSRPSPRSTSRSAGRPTSAKYKQFQRGITELHHEGVVQTLRSDMRGEPSPVLAAVGPMQFDVVSHRMAGEFNCPVHLEQLGYQIARRTTAEHAPLLDAVPGVEVLTSLDGDRFALFPDRWRLQRIEREHPEVVLDALAADSLG